MISSELTEPVSLYNNDGSINLGWSRHPVYDLNIDKARFMKLKAFQRYRTKKWDYYYVFSDEFFFSITLADLGYAGMVFAYFYDYNTNSITEDTLAIPFAGGFEMARNSGGGRTCYENKKVKVLFDADESGRHVVLDWPSFNCGQGVKADFKLLKSKDLESICVVTPIEIKKMNYTHKICCMETEGHIKWGDREKEFRPERDLGGLDWSRAFIGASSSVYSLRLDNMAWRMYDVQKASY